MEHTIARGSTHGTIVSTSVDGTRSIGRALGRAATPGTVLALVGELGAGKTQLAKGVADGLGVTGVVNSPTFVLMNEHVGRLRLHHIDAYRLDDPEDAMAAGLIEDRNLDGVTVIEWADRLEDWLPADRLDIVLEPTDEPDMRRLRWNAHGEPHRRLAAEALDAP
jgi:tRNA threonylcarbamoyladenosine biosynthesis protein TsaE